VECVSDKNSGAVGQRSVKNAVLEDRFTHVRIHGAERIIQKDDIGRGVGGPSERYTSLSIYNQ
jgi:hypothetical protein